MTLRDTARISLDWVVPKPDVAAQLHRTNMWEDIVPSVLANVSQDFWGEVAVETTGQMACRFAFFHFTVYQGYILYQRIYHLSEHRSYIKRMYQRMIY